MAHVERTDQEIIAAYEKWLENHLQPDKPSISFGQYYTPRELVTAIKDTDSYVFITFVRNVHNDAKKYDQDPLERILLELNYYTRTR